MRFTGNSLASGRVLPNALAYSTPKILLGEESNCVSPPQAVNAAKRLLIKLSPESRFLARISLKVALSSFSIAAAETKSPLCPRSQPKARLNSAGTCLRHCAAPAAKISAGATANGAGNSITASAPHKTACFARKYLSVRHISPRWVKQPLITQTTASQPLISLARSNRYLCPL